MKSVANSVNSVNDRMDSIFVSLSNTVHEFREKLFPRVKKSYSHEKKNPNLDSRFFFPQNLKNPEFAKLNSHEKFPATR